MFGIAWSEFLVIAIIALVVVPPKDLPAMMRTVGKWIGQMRRMTSDFQSQVQGALREAEFEDLRKSMDVSTMDAMADIREELESAAKPFTEMDSQIRDDLNIESSRGNKSFPLDINAPSASTVQPPQVDNTAAGHVAWPSAMEAAEVNESALEALPDHVASEPAPSPVAIEMPRLPAHLRGPDPEPPVSIAEAEIHSEEHDEPVARVSGASS